jgi:hypothetical protein
VTHDTKKRRKFDLLQRFISVMHSQESVMTADIPRWQDLLTRMLAQDTPAEMVSEVEPYQAQPALGMDLTLTWREALLPALLLSEETVPVSAHFPAAWSAARYVDLLTPFPCCIGMAPQFLQQIQALLENSQHFFVQTLPVSRPRFTAEPTLDSKTVISQLAVARLAGDHDKSRELITQLAVSELQKNELGAQHWLEGDRDTAAMIWNELPADHPVIAFNQALAALSSKDAKQGKACLQRAIDGFDESTGWHHLSELYLALAEAGL